MSLKSDAKFKEKVSLGSKNEMKNLVNLNESSGKSENQHFDLLFCQQHIKFQLKKYRRIISHYTKKKDPNFKEKLTFCLKNDMSNLLNLNPSSGKSENLHFDGILLQKVCHV